MANLHGTKRKMANQKPTHSKRPKFGSNSKAQHKQKDKAFQRSTVPIPEGTREEDLELSDQDLELLDQVKDGAAFLTSLDAAAISKSKHDIQKLARLSKPAPLKRAAPASSHSASDMESLNSDISDEEFSLPSSEGSEDEQMEPNSDIEKEYETRPRKRRPSWDDQEEQEKNLVPRLPIKLEDGTIKQTGKRRIESGVEMPEPPKFTSQTSAIPYVVEDVSTGARFGRPAVIDVVSIASRPERINAAKEQLAIICQDIVADPENGTGLLRRLHTFSLPEISSSSHPTPVTNDPAIRKYAILSQLAVFKDVIPGYRIRSLTDLEKAEKVTQFVMRTREWEQGLLSAYQKFLANAHSEVKAKSDLAGVSLRCLCTLLLEATHFNFRANILNTIVVHLSRKSWTEDSQLCYSTLVKLFRKDREGTPSLEAVRFLNRMIKERHYGIHPNVLTCLLHLRLKTELDVRASQTRADKGVEKTEQRKVKKKDRPHLSKKGKKALKENKAIQAEMKEAEAQIDHEERTSRQTETLKLLFVLYFSILKSGEPLSKLNLLAAALEGVSKFAHLVNIDFFRDLMAVLRGIVRTCGAALGMKAGDSSGDEKQRVDRYQAMRLQLLCIITAFELLTGQGEALNIDLDDFVNELYALIIPLATEANIEEAYPNKASDPDRTFQGDTATTSLSDLMFRALSHLLEPRSTQHQHTNSRTAAFASRLLIAATHFPPLTAVHTLTMIHSLLTRFPMLDALLSSEDRAANGGIYRADIDDVQVCNPFGTCWYSLFLLMEHVDERVRTEAHKVASFVR